jgi:MinD superfamily P-loop ATPase
MKEIVIISGKGGTGKSSIAASLAVLGGKEILIADCDVDAADLHLLLEPDFARKEDFYSGQLATIDEDNCIQCGKCEEVCRFNAISMVDGKYMIDPVNCEGCGYCARVCPSEAIINYPSKAGQWFVSTIKTGSSMVHAKLGIGSDNSGKLVARVKNEARNLAKDHNIPFIVIDGAPGIGCPVISSLTGADFVIFVTEPTVSGIHDLKRVYELSKTFRLKTGCIINKWDINPEITAEIEAFIRHENMLHIANLPYDETITKAMTERKTIVEYPDGGIKENLIKSWEKIKQEII